MSITTYAELQTALQTWEDRTDLSSLVADFITLFEAEANRVLRVRQMLTTTTLTPVSGDATLPTDYLEWKRVTITGSTPSEFEWVEPGLLQLSYPAGAFYLPEYSVPPGVFTIEGSTLKVRPANDDALDFAYYQKIPVLSVSNTSNWLLAAHPDAYLCGGLAELNIYKEDTDKAQFWAARRDRVFAEIARLSEASRGQTRIRPTSPTP